MGRISKIRLQITTVSCDHFMWTLWEHGPFCTSIIPYSITYFITKHNNRLIKKDIDFQTGCKANQYELIASSFSGFSPPILSSFAPCHNPSRNCLLKWLIQFRVHSLGVVSKGNHTNTCSNVPTGSTWWATLPSPVALQLAPRMDNLHCMICDLRAARWERLPLSKFNLSFELCD